MKLIFFGTGSFGLPSLEALKNSHHEILAVVTSPDRPKGRYLKSEPSVIKKWAIERDIKTLQFENVNAEEAIQTLKALKADAFIVISFGVILSNEVIALPRYMTLNVHSSLLPKYRGAAPIHWALLNGDAQTGVTLMRMVEKLDAGDILLQKETPISPDDDILSLEKRLADLGAEALLEVLEKIEQKNVTFQPQDDRRSSYARKLTKEDGHIDWKKTARLIQHQIQALKEWPTSYSFYTGKRLIISKVEVSDRPAPQNVRPGTILKASLKEGLEVAAKDFIVKIEKLKLEGKKELEASEFLKGFSLKEGQLLE